MNEYISETLKQIIIDIFSTNKPEKLEIYFENFLFEFNKISFNSDLIEMKKNTLKILTDSFQNHYDNCVKETNDRFDTKDLVFSFANISQLIELNKQ